MTTKTIYLDAICFNCREQLKKINELIEKADADKALNYNADAVCLEIELTTSQPSMSGISITHLKVKGWANI
jgi:hypothetical protein